MKEIITINLENEMDLIAAHKRTMKLAELTGFSISVQTIFATAVSEITRCAIEHGKSASFALGIDFLKGHKRQLCAVISDGSNFCTDKSDAVIYARRLVDDVTIERSPEETRVRLRCPIPFAANVTDAKVKSFVEYFENEVPLSPYDELKRKNVQLQDLAAKLRSSEENYQQLTDSLPLMMLSFDRNGKVTYVNKWLKDFLGFKPLQLYASICQPFIHPDDYKMLYKRWRKSQGDLTPIFGQVRLKNVESGNFVWHMVSILPPKDESLSSDLWIGFIVDIHAQKLVEQTLKDNTELKETQKKLEQYQHDLETKVSELARSNDELEQFAYIASHDLQEPLRKIQIFADLLQLSAQDEQKSKFYFDKIHASAERMTALIKGVLEYSRLSKAEEQFEEVNLNRVLENVETDFELTIQQKKAVIQRGKLPVVRGIAMQLYQLFANLISNALKFSSERPVIEIGARNLPADIQTSHPLLQATRRYVELTFKDNGIGFEQKYAQQVFTIFRRLNNRQHYNGTGIGLALCKKIVENHRGVIEVASQPNLGTTFTIYLPKG